jgi:hypothetical protein
MLEAVYSVTVWNVLIMGSRAVVLSHSRFFDSGKY